MKFTFRIVLLLIFVLWCFSEEYKIAYNEGNKIIIINQDGKELERIVLPRKINTFSFTPKRDKVVYSSSFNGKFWKYSTIYERIFIYDMEKKEEKKLTEGPYIYKGNVYKYLMYDLNGRFIGKNIPVRESHFSPDISPDGRYIAFVIAPEELITSDVCYQEGWPEYFEIGILDIEKGKFTRVTNNEEDSDDSPIWSPDGEKILFWGTAHTKVYSIKLQKIILELEEAEGYSLGPHMQWTDNNSFLFFYYHYTDRPPPYHLQEEEKIMEYDIKTSKVKKVVDLSPFKEYDYSLFDYVAFLHMSKDRNYLVFEKNYRIYLIDIKNHKVKIIKEIDEKRRRFYGALHQSIWPKFIE